MFRAESVGEALSIVLERFPKLPKVSFYDLTCELDKNALRRVRPIMRAHGVRCILDRPHSITHSCSPVYMPDESLGSTAGVATQAAEVSHSIAAANRTSLAYMAPATYMVHKMVHVAMMNIRKIHRVCQTNSAGENEHVPLAPFFHSRRSRVCTGWSVCACQAGVADFGRRDSEGTFMSKLAARGDDVDEADEDGNLLPEEVLDGAVTCSDDDGAASDDDVHPPPGVEPGVGPEPVIACDEDTGAECEVGSPLSPGLMMPLSTEPLSPHDAALVESLTAARPRASAVRGENKARTVLSVQEFITVREERCLNDEILNSFVALVNHRSNVATRVASVGVDVSGEAPPVGTPPTQLRALMFGTFILSRLLERRGTYDYDGPRNWGRKSNLCPDAVDIIIVPTNEHGDHWVLVVIDVQARNFLFYDRLFGSKGERYIPALRGWLDDELSTRLSPEVASEWDVHSWPAVVDGDLPRQQDHVSCGVFVLAVSDCLAVGVHPCCTQSDIPVLRNRSALALYKDYLTGAARSEPLLGGG